MCAQSRRDLGQSQFPELLDVGAVHQALGGVQHMVLHHEEPEGAAEWLSRQCLRRSFASIRFRVKHAHKEQSNRRLNSVTFLDQDLQHTFGS